MGEGEERVECVALEPLSSLRKIRDMIKRMTSEVTKNNLNSEKQNLARVSNLSSITEPEIFCGLQRTVVAK